MIKSNGILSNIIGLGIFKVLNISLTFLTLPYLLRVMGPDKWGEVVFVQLIINYLVWFTNWGFYYGATREISSTRDDINKRTLVFSEVWTAQAVLTILVSLLFFSWIAIWPMEVGTKILYLSSFGLVIGNFLAPLWYFNGLELVKESEFITLLNKALLLPLIFILVNDENDAYLYFMLNSISSILVGFFSLYWLIRKRIFNFILPNPLNVIRVISNDFLFFLNSFMSTLNASIVPFFLGVSSNMSELGYYNVAERIRGVAVTCLQPISHALFPRMCYLFSIDGSSAKKMLRMSGGIIMGLALFISVLMFFFSDEITVLMGGGQFELSSNILKVMAVTAFLITLTAFLTDQVIIPNNWQKIFSLAIFVSVIFNAAFVYLVISYFGAFGGSLLVLFSQAILLSILLIFLLRKSREEKI